MFTLLLLPLLLGHTVLSVEGDLVSAAVEEGGGDGELAGGIGEDEEEGDVEVQEDPLGSLGLSQVIHPGDLPDPTPGTIDVAFILIGLQGGEARLERRDKLAKQFITMIDSIFLYSKGSPLRFIFLTDNSSAPVISELLKQRAGRLVTAVHTTSHRITPNDLMSGTCPIVY